MSDRVVLGKLHELAELPGMPSEPVLRRLIRDNMDFPVVSTGTNGRAYEIDIAAAVLWVRNHEEAKRQAERDRGEELRQLSMDLLGPDAASNVAQAGLSPAERKALLEEELIATKLAERRGELVRKESVEAAFTAVFDLLGQQRRGLAARLAKRSDLSRKQQTLIEELLDRDLDELAAKFEEMGRGGGMPDGDPAL